jgi:hypothetical protein
MLAAEGGNPAGVTEQAKTWLNASAELGLGANNLDSIEWMEVQIGNEETKRIITLALSFIFMRMCL